MTEKIARTYSSERMTTRRERIVRIARGILAEGGPDALTINRLSEEAKVAPSTIYRSFESKEGVILATIVDHMSGIRDYLLRSPTRGDLDSIFSEYDWIAAELFRDPEYARVVIDFYFSSDAKPIARKALRSVAHMRITDWITRADAHGILVPGLNRDRLIEYQVDTEYIVLHKWARRLIAKERLADELKVNFLMTAAAAVIDKEQQDIIARLTGLHAQLGTPPVKALLDQL
jgi:AcrR family transcriptional regulator